MSEDLKPMCKLTGINSNILNLIGIAGRVLRDHNRMEKAEEMQRKVFTAKSYDEALRMIGEYVDIV